MTSGWFLRQAGMRNSDYQVLCPSHSNNATPREGYRRLDVSTYTFIDPAAAQFYADNLCGYRIDEVLGVSALLFGYSPMFLPSDPSVGRLVEGKPGVHRVVFPVSHVSPNTLLPPGSFPRTPGAPVASVLEFIVLVCIKCSTTQSTSSPPMVPTAEVLEGAGKHLFSKGR